MKQTCLLYLFNIGKYMKYVGAAWIHINHDMAGRFCYVTFNSHMFNAPRFNSEKEVSLKKFFTLNEANTCVALPNA
jgi:hypothetical protein